MRMGAKRGGTHQPLPRVHKGIAGAQTDLKLLYQNGAILNSVANREGLVQLAIRRHLWRGGGGTSQRWEGRPGGGRGLLADTE